VYPVTIEAHDSKRRSILDRLMTEARERAEENGRSVNCKDRRKWFGTEHQPCLGGPERCLCECHDPVLVAAGESAET
jgi:hypothetical protein